METETDNNIVIKTRKKKLNNNINKKRTNEMKKFLTLTVMMLTTACMMAQTETKAEKKDSVNPNKPVFTVIKENPITSIKNQARSGTCWNYSTLSFFEAEILKNNLIDYEGGEWYWSRHPNGTLNLDDDKAGFWKCPYHNSRMCLEIIERI